MATAMDPAATARLLAVVNAGHEITSVPLAGVPSPRYTTSCTVVVLPAGACAAILTASSSEIRQQKSRLRRLGLSILVFICFGPNWETRLGKTTEARSA